MGLARLEISFLKSIEPLELSAMLLSLPRGSKIVESSRTESNGEFNIFYLFVEHPMFKDNAILKYDFERKAYIEEGHLKTVNVFRGLDGF